MPRVILSQTDRQTDRHETDRQTDRQQQLKHNVTTDHAEGDLIIRPEIHVLAEPLALAE